MTIELRRRMELLKDLLYSLVNVPYLFHYLSCQTMLQLHPAGYCPVTNFLHDLSVLL